MKIADLFIKLGLRKEGFDKGLDDAKQKTNAFGSAMKRIGSLAAGLFAVDRLIAFGKELFNIARQASGVENAFYRIADASDLANLRKSVKGTVSDLELMKRAVNAANFGIPVQELGNLLEFAAKRAQDTGQSVDYLVDSIVTGIGRKSPLILDNLGISAIQLTKELNGASVASASIGEVTAAVGRIAAKSLNETGRLTNNFGTIVQRLSSKYENLKLKIVDAFNPKNIYIKSGEIEQQQRSVNALAIEFNSANTPLERRRDIITQINSIAPDLVKNISDEGDELKTATINLKEYNAEQINRIIIAKEQDRIDAQIQKKNDLLVRQRENEINLYDQLAKVQANLSKNDYVKNYKPQLAENINNVLSSNLSAYEKGVKISGMFADATRLLTISEQRRFNGLNVNAGVLRDYNQTQQELIKIDNTVGRLTSEKTDLMNKLGISESSVTETTEYATEATEKQATRLKALEQAAKDARAELEAFKKLPGEFAGEKSAQAYIDKLDELEKKVKDRQSAFEIATIGVIQAPEIDSSVLGDALKKFNEDFQKAFDESEGIKIKIDPEIEIDDTKIMDSIKEFKEDFKKSINEQFKAGIADAVTTMSTNLGEAIESGDWSGFGAGLLDIVGKFMQQLGSLIITLGASLLKVNIGLASANPFLIIGAGALLVAAGAAVSSFASKGLDSSSSASAYSGASGYSASSSSATTALSGDVRFVLEGDKLVGAIGASNRKRAITG